MGHDHISLRALDDMLGDDMPRVRDTVVTALKGVWGVCKTGENVELESCGSIQPAGWIHFAGVHSKRPVNPTVFSLVVS